MDRRPIGVFDSGLGGLTVVREIKKILPGEDIVYFGDTARVPYGTKSKDTVTRFSRENIEFLLKFRMKAIVVACNTASSLSLGSLAGSFDIPIIGVIKPGVEKALKVSSSGAVGVIGTRATIASGAYEKLLKRQSPATKVLSRHCGLFVPLVEEGWLDNKITSKVVREYLEDFKKANVKTLILGCTHYPLLKHAISGFMGRGVELVDSAEETARVVSQTLGAKGLLSDKKARGLQKYFVSDEPAAFKKVGEKFLGGKITSIKRIS